MTNSDRPSHTSTDPCTSASNIHKQLAEIHELLRATKDRCAAYAKIIEEREAAREKALGEEERRMRELRDELHHFKRKKDRIRLERTSDVTGKFSRLNDFWGYSNNLLGEDEISNLLHALEEHHREQTAAIASMFDGH